jgi:hypothetical protein
MFKLLDDIVDKHGHAQLHTDRQHEGGSQNYWTSS